MCHITIFGHHQNSLKFHHEVPQSHLSLYTYILQFFHNDEITSQCNSQTIFSLLNDACLYMHICDSIKFWKLCFHGDYQESENIVHIM